MLIGLILLATPAAAVSLRIETTSGDSTFFAPVGDTVSVAVIIDANEQALTGVEVFLTYDPRLFALADTTQSNLLLGRVLIDTLLGISDSVAVVHYAEAHLAGKAVSGPLFSVKFRVVDGISGSSQISFANATLGKSLYTIPSREADTFAFESVSPLTYGDTPPVLTLPWRFEMLEDSILTVNLRELAQDAESLPDLLTWQVASEDTLIRVISADAQTVVLHPAPNVWGDRRLVFTVTDPSGGIATGTAALRIWPINDSPVILAGSIPDSLNLTERNAQLALSAQDADENVLTWSAVVESPLVVTFDQGDLARISAPLDWVGVSTVVLEVSDGEGGQAVHAVVVVRTQALNVLPGDFDGDGRVAFADFLAFARAFGSEAPSVEADLNGDGQVDFADFLVLVQNFGRTSE